MTLTTLTATTGRDQDRALGPREAVVPGGMYGHLNRATFPPDYPQFFARGERHPSGTSTATRTSTSCAPGARWSLGLPAPAGRGARTSAARRGRLPQRARRRPMVELAELLVDTVAHADWAMFSKNGTDATTTALTIARAATGRRKVLEGARRLPRRRAVVHARRWPGSPPRTAPTCSSSTSTTWRRRRGRPRRPPGDVAAIIATPFQHDSLVDQEDVDPAFARGLRALADRLGAALVLDDVRCGFRYDVAGSWEPLGVRPDLSAPAARRSPTGTRWPPSPATTPCARRRASVFATGSFWFAAAPMAAAVATITELRDGTGLADVRGGRAAAARRARRTGRAPTGCGCTRPGRCRCRCCGSRTTRLREGRAAGAARRSTRGVYVHPWHNWFLSAAHTSEDIEEALAVTDPAFAVVAGEAAPTGGTSIMPGAGMPKIVDHDQRREEIVAATWRVIDRHGLDEATTRRIAEEAGYSNGVLAHYFRDKDDILVQALQLAHAHVRARVGGRRRAAPGWRRSAGRGRGGAAAGRGAAAGGAGSSSSFLSGRAPCRGCARCTARSARIPRAAWPSSSPRARAGGRGAREVTDDGRSGEILVLVDGAVDPGGLLDPDGSPPRCSCAMLDLLLEPGSRPGRTCRTARTPARPSGRAGVRSRRRGRRCRRCQASARPSTRTRCPGAGVARGSPATGRTGSRR